MSERIRVATPDDAGAVRSIYAPFVADTAVTFETDVPEEAELAAEIEESTERYPWLVYVDDGTVAGYARASRLRSAPAYDWAVELSVYVAEDARRSGVGRTLYATLFDALALQGYCDAYAATTLPNPATVGLHESMGFERVGRFPSPGHKLGEWHDVAWWHRQVRDRPEDPDPPTPLCDVRGTPAFEAALQVDDDQG